MGKALADFGLQLGQSAIGTGMGMLLGKWNDKRQLEMQRKLNAMQLQDSKAMTDYTFKKQLQMWKDTNYSAQKEQLKEAGLNPGLLYGMSGGGGVTTGGGASMVGAGHAPTGGGEAVAMSAHAAQLALMNAQRENIEADTKNKEAENPNIPLKGEETKARTADLLQGVENKKAQEKLTKIQTNLASIDERLKNETLDDMIKIVDWQEQKIMNEVEGLYQDNFIKKGTATTIIRKAKAELANIYAMNALIKSHTNLNKQEIENKKQEISESIARIAQGWEQDYINKARLDDDQAQKRHDQWVNDLQKSTGLPIDIVKDVINVIFLRDLFRGGSHTPIRGFRP